MIFFFTIIIFVTSESCYNQASCDHRETWGCCEDSYPPRSVYKYFCTKDGTMDGLTACPQKCLNGACMEYNCSTGEPCPTESVDYVLTCCSDKDRLAVCNQNLIVHVEECESGCRVQVDDTDGIQVDDYCYEPCEVGRRCPHDAISIAPNTKTRGAGPYTFCCDINNVAYCSSEGNVEHVFNCPFGCSNEVSVSDGESISACNTVQWDPCPPGAPCKATSTGDSCCEGQFEIECGEAGVIVYKETCEFGCSVEVEEIDYSSPICFSQCSLGSFCTDSEMNEVQCCSEDVLGVCDFSTGRYTNVLSCSSMDGSNGNCLEGLCQYEHEDTCGMPGTLCFEQQDYNLDIAAGTTTKNEEVQFCCDRNVHSVCYDGSFVISPPESCEHGCFADKCVDSACAVGSLCSNPGEWRCCDDETSTLAFCDSEGHTSMKTNCSETMVNDINLECIESFCAIDIEDPDHDDEIFLCKVGAKCELSDDSVVRAAGSEWQCCGENAEKVLCYESRVVLNVAKSKDCKETIVIENDNDDNNNDNDNNNDDDEGGIFAEFWSSGNAVGAIGGTVGIVGFGIILMFSIPVCLMICCWGRVSCCAGGKKKDPDSNTEKDDEKELIDCNVDDKDSIEEGKCTNK